MPKFGKIAILPTIFRNVVNRMIDENVPDTDIGVKITKMLAKAANPIIAEVVITPQNVNNWKQGGYRKWQAEAKARDLAERIALASADGKKIGDGGVADNISAILLGEIAVQVTNLVEGKMSERERRATIDWIVPHVTALRRGENARSWIRLEATKLELALTKAAGEKRGEEAEPLTGRLEKGLSDELFAEMQYASGMDTPPEGYEYKILTPDDVERIANEWAEAVRRM